MIYAGRMRVYFAHHNVAPLVWCVQALGPDDEPLWEISVIAVGIVGAASTVYRPKATADHEDSKPSAWLEATGELHLNGSQAMIVAEVPA